MTHSDRSRIALGAFVVLAFGATMALALRFSPKDTFLSGRNPGGDCQPGADCGPGRKGISPLTHKTAPGGGPPRLSGPIELDYTPVLEIRSLSPRYWRMASYDIFNGLSWEGTHARTRLIQCDQPIGLKTAATALLDITVRVLASGNIQSHLVAPLTPSRICAGNAAVSLNDSSFGLTVDVPLPVNSEYRASSILGDIPPETLRSAPEAIPSDIRRRYLQLPRNTPQRIRDLARQVTIGAPNRYDKAKAIESHLAASGRYDYSLTPPVTPSGRNAVDYFLFDIRKGYCEYFSSAMVVLLRSIGIPSREVVGLAPGPWDARTKSVILTNEHAHAWVEVYFPTYGWVEFEPTAGGPARPGLASGNRVNTKTSIKIPTETRILTSPRSFYRKDNPRVTGTVKRLDGTPVRTAAVVLYMAEDKKAQGTRIGGSDTDASGRFSSEVSVEPDFKIGRYQLIARYAGDQAYLASDSDPEVMVRARVAMDISAAVSEGKITIGGSLRDDAGKPLAGARVAVFLDRIGAGAAKTDDGGRFSGTFSAVPGKHAVTLHFAGTEAYDETRRNISLMVPSPSDISVADPSAAPPPRSRKGMHWAFIIAALFGSIAVGAYAWSISKRQPQTIQYRAGEGSPTSSSGNSLDIRFPRIDPDLPLFWGTTDPPIEVVVVKPDGCDACVTVNGKEQRMPNEKGDYLFRLEFRGQKVVKTVRVIEYGEEIEKDFKALYQGYRLDPTELTAREIIGRIEQEDPGFKRPELLLSLFEKRVYGKQVISRTEYVACYRSLSLIRTSASSGA